LVAGTTYQYRLSAVNFAGKAVSNVVTVAVLPPDAATGLSATINGAGGVDLAWTLPVLGAPATSQSVQRSTDGGTTWTTLAPAPLVTDVTYHDGTAAIGSTYTYRVGRTNLAGTTYSNLAIATFVPSAPSALTATLAAGPTVNLSWVNPAGTLTGVVVERASAAGGPWSALTPPVGAPSTYADSTVTPDGTYYYRVSATNTAGTSVPSAVASVAVIRPAAPSTPTVALTSLANVPSATVSWTDNATTETGFVVQRSTDAGLTWTSVGTPAAKPGTGAMSFVDTTVASGATYRYRVGAVNFAGTSYSAMSLAAVVVLPVAPTNFTYTLQAAPTRVRLAWVDASTNENGFVIQRSADGGLTWTQLTVQGASGGTGSNRNWTDTTAVLGTTYQYRVAARNANGLSFTPTLTIAVAAPPAPTITSAIPGVTSATREQIVINWTAVPLATSGYTVQWSTTAGLPVTGSVNVGAAATVNTRTNLLRQVWYVRVGSRNALGTTYSAWMAVPAV
jgi:fibronectin type 3 domain-containing protein